MAVIGPKFKAAIERKKRGDLRALVAAFSPKGVVLPKNLGERKAERAIKRTLTAVQKIESTTGFNLGGAAKELRRVAKEIKTRNQIMASTTNLRLGIRRSREAGVRPELLKIQTRSFVTPKEGVVTKTGFVGGPQKRRITPRQPNLSGTRRIKLPRR